MMKSVSSSFKTKEITMKFGTIILSTLFGFAVSRSDTNGGKCVYDESC